MAKAAGLMRGEVLMQKKQRGRPAKHGSAMTTAERAAEYRARQKARGLKQVTVWVPIETTTAEAQEAVDAAMASK